MLYYNFKYEYKLLIRSRWIQLISLLLLGLFVFAAHNGKQKVEKRKADILTAREMVKTSDKEMLSLLDSLENGLELNMSPWRIPNSPMAIGNFHPRIAAMDPDALGFLAVGQSDIFAHYVKPVVSGSDFELEYVEMTSPIQLLFGSFDLSFVIVYLLPLLIIAFSYNILSEEKERGSLSLVASQPISIQKWVFQKLCLRLFWMSVILAIVSVIVFLFNGITSLSGFISFLGIVFCYMVFWFCLAFAINISGTNSAKNAVSLLGLWIVFVLLLPSAISQTGNIIYPIPSRITFVNEVRALEAETSKKQDEILNDFLRNHPEYAINGDSQARSYWLGHAATLNLMEEELKPLISNYEDKLNKQQSWVADLQWTSPAIIAQRALGSLAGTTKQDYDNYRNQVKLFSAKWRNYFMPLLYTDKMFEKSMYAELPVFNYKAKNENPLLISIVGLLIISIITLMIPMVRYNRRLKRRGILML